jgi:hypothetical protein
LARRPTPDFISNGTDIISAIAERLRRQPDRSQACPNVSVDRTDSLARRDSHLGSRYRPENLRHADCGSRPARGSGRENRARRDSRASNAPPAVDRSDALGPRTVGRRRDLQYYSAYEPCHSCFERNPYVHRAPPPAIRLAQRCRATACTLNVATFWSSRLITFYSINSRLSLVFRGAEHDDEARRRDAESRQYGEHTDGRDQDGARGCRRSSSASPSRHSDMVATGGMPDNCHRPTPATAADHARAEPAPMCKK